MKGSPRLALSGAAPTNRPLRLLLIEDHDASAVALERALVLADPQLRIERVDRLDAAASRLGDADRYDVVLCDLSLPDADGTEAPELVRELKPNVAVVVLTGYRATDLALRLVRIGVQDFLPKVEVTAATVARTIRMAFERSRREETAQQAALLDPLCRVLNRRGLDQALSSAVHAADRLALPAALALIDLDDFKSINDRFGHPVGDATLRQVAERLTHATRPSDVVGRLGGDEFAIVFSGFATAVDVPQIGQKLLRRFRHPIRIGDLSLPLTVSIGIALYPQHASEVTAWLACADRAMYRAKHRGKAGFAIYDSSRIGVDAPITP